MGRRPKNNTRDRTELTPLELSIMQVLWDKGSATAAEVVELLKDTNSLAPTTVHTVLANLRKRGVIEPVPTVERALRFAPRLAREQIGGRRLREVLAEFFDGSPRRLVAHLLDDETVDETERERLRRLLAESNPSPEGDV